MRKDGRKPQQSQTTSSTRTLNNADANPGLKHGQESVSTHLELRRVAFAVTRRVALTCTKPPMPPMPPGLYIADAKWITSPYAVAMPPRTKFSDAQEKWIQDQMEEYSKKFKNTPRSADFLWKTAKWELFSAKFGSVLDDGATTSEVWRKTTQCNTPEVCAVQFRCKEDIDAAIRARTEADSDEEVPSTPVVRIQRAARPVVLDDDDDETPIPKPRSRTTSHDDSIVPEVAVTNTDTPAIVNGITSSREPIACNDAFSGDAVHTDDAEKSTERPPAAANTCSAGHADADTEATVAANDSINRDTVKPKKKGRPAKQATAASTTSQNAGSKRKRAQAAAEGEIDDEVTPNSPPQDRRKRSRSTRCPGCNGTRGCCSCTPKKDGTGEARKRNARR
ncbi:hypothetical protein BD410DRAFT_810172 [Rickenella mellea]|uniref:Uncharacterized protein n=1 Tax=Rickenella mellea TaxID=50990 RepID=A0A4Y7PFR9_9AGAM|nr:hypothetical protein BD410DRAFT_810172 [Rickenella mellea]